MNDDILISVIVPVYNKEKYISECVDSLLGQTYRNIEIVLVDDGSTDSSGMICDSYKDERIKVLHKENGGPSSAWKAGFDVSGGEYIMFVDSDDYVEPVMVEEMAQNLARIPGEMAISDYVIDKADGSKRYVYQSLECGEYKEDKIKTCILPDMLGTEQKSVSFSRCMKLIERSLIEDNKKWCDNKVILGDDSTIILPIMADCKRLYMMDKKAYYHYRFIDDSIVHKYDEKAYENNLLHYEAIKRIIDGKLSPGALKGKMLEALDKEEILQLVLLVKKEIRNNYPHSYENLRKLRKERFVSDIVENTRIRINEKANKLLYGVLKHPGRLNIAMVKLAFLIYDR